EDKTNSAFALYTAGKPYCWQKGYGTRYVSRDGGPARDAWVRNWRNKRPWKPATEVVLANDDGGAAVGNQNHAGFLCRIDNFNENLISLGKDSNLFAACADALEYVNRVGELLNLPSGFAGDHLPDEPMSTSSAFFEKEVKFSLLTWFDEENYNQGAEWKCEVMCDMVSSCVMYQFGLDDGAGRTSGSGGGGSLPTSGKNERLTCTLYGTAEQSRGIVDETVAAPDHDGSDHDTTTAPPVAAICVRRLCDVLDDETLSEAAKVAKVFDFLTTAERADESKAPLDVFHEKYCEVKVDCE
ncbi:unnamed protein product, partial [Amoebophrya sp. A120]